MRVNVDESRCYEQSARIDLRSAGPDIVPNGDNCLAIDRDIGDAPW